MGKEAKREPNEREQAISKALASHAEGLREDLRPPISHEEVLVQGTAFIKRVFDKFEEEYPDIARQFKNNPDQNLVSDPQ